MSVKTGKYLSKNIISTLVLFWFLIAVSIFVIWRIEGIVNASCFRALLNMAEYGAGHIRIMMESEEKWMEAIAGILADHENMTEEDCRKYLGALQSGGLISSFSVLYPNGRMVYSCGSVPLMDTAPDYETESKKGAAFYGLRAGSSKAAYSVYRFPIRKKREMAGILYGYISLDDLSDKIQLLIDDSRYGLYLIDGNTGNALANTRHEGLGNMDDGGAVNSPADNGAGFRQIKRNIENGQPNYFMFESKTTGEDFYSCYAPVGKHDLFFQAAAPEPVIFADTIRIRKIVLIFCGAEILSMLCYMTIKFRLLRLQSRKTQKIIDMNRIINDAHRILFESYDNPSFITKALDALAGELSVGQIILLILEKGKVKKLYGLSAMDLKGMPDYTGCNIKDDLYAVIADRLYKRTIKLDSSCKAKLNRAGKLPGIQLGGVKNFVAAWEFDQDGDISAVIYMVNVREPDIGLNVLETVSETFQMADRTTDSYNMLYQMGEVDFLTGLKNRNAYEKDLSAYDKSGNLVCCIYADANGLHDLNNNYGHESGDKMLKYIGYQIKELFGFETSYRIGGDEFLLFCIGMKKDAILKRIQALQDRLREADYHISVGMAFRENGMGVQRLISDAETQMYENKREFYNTVGDRRQSRIHNQELEQLMLEKRDRDEFIGAVSSTFLGVYAVSLSEDRARLIQCVSYFKEILEETDYYLDAMKQYAEHFVSDADYEKLVRFLDYKQIVSAIKKTYCAGCRYRKKNGDLIYLRVLPMKDFLGLRQDTLWIFEKYQEREAR